jgi:predicted ATPase
VAVAVAALLQSCSRVQILATSREALGIRGERTYRVPSLSAPALDETRPLPVDEALRYDAVALFAVRAEAADSRFALTQEVVPTVVEICRRLDGIALAIELAAARVNVLSATTLANKLNERFLILTGGSRTALPRHKTMRAMHDWSYDLLEEREQDLFRKLSIFAGGFTFELVTAVCAGEGISESDVLDLLGSLVDKSLVQTEVEGETRRCALLESTRQYAYEKLRQRGEHVSTARAHALAMLALAERFDSALELTPDRFWTASVKPELENWRAALEWALGPEGDVRIGQQLAGSLSEVWRYQRGEGQHWVRAALKTCDDATPTRVRAGLELAEALVLAQLQNEASLAAAERALTLYKQAGDSLGVAKARHYAGQALIFSGRLEEGEKLARAALAAARRGGDRRLIALTTIALANARYLDSDLRAARKLYREGLTLYKAAGCERYAGRVALNLAEAEFQVGNVETALQLAGEAAEALGADVAFPAAAAALCNCSAYLIALTRVEEARGYAREALILAHEAGFDLHVVWALHHLAAIAALREGDNAADRLVDLQRAARVLGFVNARFPELEPARQYTEQQEYDKMLPVLRNELGADLDALMTEGKQWPDDRAVAEALMIEALEIVRPSTSSG